MMLLCLGRFIDGICPVDDWLAQETQLRAQTSMGLASLHTLHQPRLSHAFCAGCSVPLPPNCAPLTGARLACLGLKLPVSPILVALPARSAGDESCEPTPLTSFLFP